MTENTELNANTFDLYAMAAGTTYPEDTLTVYTDGATANEIHKRNVRLKDATTDEAVELEKELDALNEKLKESEITLYLKGIPARTRDKLIDTLDEEFGKLEKDNIPEGYAEAHRAECLILMLTKAVNHSGAVATVAGWDRNKAEQFFLMFPDYYRNKIANKITELLYSAQHLEDVEVSTDF